MRKIKPTDTRSSDKYFIPSVYESYIKVKPGIRNRLILTALIRRKYPNVVIKTIRKRKLVEKTPLYWKYYLQFHVQSRERKSNFKWYTRG